MNLTKYGYMGYNQVKGLVSYVVEPKQPFHNSGILITDISDDIWKYDIRTFVETGTYRGDSIDYVAKRFSGVNCVSCDISPIYYALAELRLSKPNTLFFNMKSQDFLNEYKFAEPVLFWLDAHWSFDLPLSRELELITSKYKKYVIYIDDITAAYHGDKITEELIKEKCKLPITYIEDDLRTTFRHRPIHQKVARLSSYES